MRFIQVEGGIHLHMRTPFPYLGNDWTHCAEIWYVVRGPLVMGFTQVMDEDIFSARVYLFSASRK